MPGGYLPNGVQNTVGQISITEESPVVVNSIVAATGDVNITAYNPSGDITINSPYSVTSSAGNVNLTADNNINMNGAVSSLTGDANLLAGTDINIGNANASAGGTLTLTADSDTNGAGSINEPSGKTGRLIAPIINLSGVAIGSSGNSILTDAGTLSATAGSDDTAGGVYISELNSIILNNVSTFNGDINITAAGDMTAANVSTGTNNDITLITTVGNITSGSIDAGSGTVTLNAAGAIVDNNGSSLNVTAGDLVLTAANGISLDTAVSRVNASNSASGNIRITNTKNLVISNFATVSPQDAGIENEASGGTVSVTATGSISLPGGAGNTYGIYSNNGAVNLTTLNSGGSNDDIVSATNGNLDTVNSHGGSITLIADNNILIGDNGHWGDIHSDGGTGGISMTAGGNITIDNDTFIVSASGNIIFNAGGSIDLLATILGGSYIHTTSGNISLTAANNILMNPGFVSILSSSGEQSIFWQETI